MEIKILMFSTQNDSLDLLCSDLCACDDLNIMREVDFDTDKALSLQKSFDPDVIIIDTEMDSDVNSKSMHQALLLNSKSEILFLIPENNGHLKHLKANGFEYLAKPFRPDVLENTIRKIFERTKQTNLSEELLSLIQEIRRNNKIRFNNMNGFILLKPSEILYAEADGNYSKILLIDGNVDVSCQNLLCLEKKLKGHGFIRLSRSYLINVAYLSGIDRKKKQCILKYHNTRIKVPIPAERLKEISKCV